MRWSRPTATLLAVAVAALFVSLAGKLNEDSRWGYWLVYGLVALAGLVVGLSQPTAAADARRMLLVAFVPVAVGALWVLVYNQPTPGALRTYVRRWSADLHLGDAIGHFADNRGVVAFALGLVLGLSLDRASLPSGMKRRLSRRR